MKKYFVSYTTQHLKNYPIKGFCIFEEDFSKDSPKDIDDKIFKIIERNTKAIKKENTILLSFNEIL